MRLIDADMLMEYCRNHKHKKIDCNDIARFPTAYDVDKVMEELETYKAKHMGSDGHYISIINKAIEIVKAGGKNEDRN